MKLYFPGLLIFFLICKAVQSTLVLDHSKGFLNIFLKPFYFATFSESCIKSYDILSNCIHT